MNHRRVSKCCTITCLLALSLPHTASADDGRDNSNEITECEEGSPVTATADRSGTDRSSDRPEHDGGHGHDARDGEGNGAHNENGEAEGEDENQDDCVLAPPPDVAEAPKALLLSASATVTGGAAVFAIRRRARNSVKIAQS